MVNWDKCTLQLQLWQPTITFHNFLREREDILWQIIAAIDILLFLRGRVHRNPLRTPLSTAMILQNVTTTFQMS